MAGGRSQRHLSEVHGVDSDGEVEGVATKGNVRLIVESGTTVVAAKFGFSGQFDADDRVVLHVATDGAASADFTYDCTGSMTPTQVATAVAALINANAEIVSSGSGGIVSATAAAPATVLTISGLKVTSD